jgi:hypothetical protein
MLPEQRILNVRARLALALYHSPGLGASNALARPKRKARMPIPHWHHVKGRRSPIHRGTDIYGAKGGDSLAQDTSHPGAMMKFTNQNRDCHAERSEASLCPSRETLRFAQGDKGGQR